MAGFAQLSLLMLATICIASAQTEAVTEDPKPAETPEPTEAPETPEPTEAPKPAETPEPTEAPKPAEVTTTVAPVVTPIIEEDTRKKTDKETCESLKLQDIERIVEFQPGSLGLNVEHGEVISVDDGSQAQDAGVQRGWLIKSVNGAKCEKFSDPPFQTAKSGNSPFKVTFSDYKTPILVFQDQMTELEDDVYTLTATMRSILDYKNQNLNLTAMERQDFQTGHDLFAQAFAGSRPQAKATAEAKLGLLKKALEKRTEILSKVKAFSEKRAAVEEKQRKQEEEEEEKRQAARRLLPETEEEKRKRFRLDINDTVIELEDSCYDILAGLTAVVQNHKYNLSDLERKDFEEGVAHFGGAYAKSKSGDVDKEGKIMILKGALPKKEDYMKKMHSVHEKYNLLEKQQEEARRKEEEEATNTSRRLVAETPEEKKARLKADINDTVIELEDEIYGLFSSLHHAIQNFNMSDLEHKDLQEGYELLSGAFNKQKSGEYDLEGKVTLLRTAHSKYDTYLTKFRTVAARHNEGVRKKEEEVDRLAGRMSV